MKKKITSLILIMVMFITIIPANTTLAASKPPTPKITSISSTFNSITIKWKKIKNAKGYEIYQKKTTGEFKKIKTITKETTVMYKKTNLDSNTKYSYKIRAFKKSGSKKIYGKFSSIKSKTTKQSPLSLSTTKLSLTNKSTKVSVTVRGNYTVWYKIGDTSVVSCKWSNKWKGDTTTLKVTPKNYGKTRIAIYLEEIDVKLVIKVSVLSPANASSLTIKGVGKKHKQYITGLPNTIKLHSATYKIEPYVDDEIAIWVDFIVSCTECIEYNGYIELRYNLYNSSGVVVDTGTTITEFTHTNTKYSDSLVFSGLPADDYKLVFSDKF